jgi:hypothetical protein
MMPAVKGSSAAAATYDQQRGALRTGAVGSSQIASASSATAGPPRPAKEPPKELPKEHLKEPLLPIPECVEDAVVPLLPLAQLFSLDHGINCTVLAVVFMVGLMARSLPL